MKFMKKLKLELTFKKRELPKSIDFDFILLESHSIENVKF